MIKKRLILVLFLILGACRGMPDSNIGESALSQEHSEEERAYAKYAEPIVLRVGFKIPDSKLTTGDTNDNNPVTRYLQNITNIKVIHSWEAKGEEAFWQKADMAIDSYDLPDALVVNRDQLWKLIDNNMIEDLTEVYNEYGSELIKDMYDSTGGMALAEVTRNGKLYALPNLAINADSPTLLWIRKDWLDRLDLQPPQTMDDIEKIAKAFVERDPDGNGKADTIGLTGYKGIVYGFKPNMNGYDSVFSAYHAFPKNWVIDSKGEVVYGSITPGNKEALAKLADWYHRGLIDKQFALYKEGQEPIVEGRAGMFFGPWWMPYWPLVDAVAVDTKSEWRAYAAPLDASGKFVTHMAPVTDRYLVIRKGYEHPEAVIKLLNAFTRLERRQDPNVEEVRSLDDFAAQTGIQPRTYYPFDLLLDYSDAIEKRYASIQQALHDKLDPETLDPDTRQIYDQWISEKEQPKKNLEGWKAVNAYEHGVSVLVSTPMDRVRSVFYGTTPGIKEHWAELEKLENETFLNIIVGDLPLSAFDDFVLEWNKRGGAQITKEVSELVARQQN